MIGPSLPPLACCVGLLSLLAVAGTDALPADQYDHEVSLLDQLLKNLERRKKVSSGSSDDVSIQDIVDSLDRRSQLTSDSLPRTLQEVLDSLSTRVEKRGQDDNDTACASSPCANGGVCHSGSDVGEYRYWCSHCNQGYSGVDCGIYDACMEKHTGPMKKKPCAGQYSELCVPVHNKKGFICF